MSRYLYTGKLAYISSLPRQLTSPGGNRSPVPLITPSAQSLALLIIHIIKGSRDLRKMADSRTGEGEAYKEPEPKSQEHRDSERQRAQGPTKTFLVVKSETKCIANFHESILM